MVLHLIEYYCNYKRHFDFNILYIFSENVLQHMNCQILKKMNIILKYVYIHVKQSEIGVI